MGFFGVRFVVGERGLEGGGGGGGAGKITPSLKLVSIMLETRNLVRKYKHICSFRKYTFLYKDTLNLADASILFCKK